MTYNEYEEINILATNCPNISGRQPRSVLDSRAWIRRANIIRIIKSVIPFVGDMSTNFLENEDSLTVTTTRKTRLLNKTQYHEAPGSFARTSKGSPKPSGL